MVTTSGSSDLASRGGRKKDTAAELAGTWPAKVAAASATHAAAFLHAILAVGTAREQDSSRTASLIAT
ncbi:hypothetical protein [Paraburkholderia rhizosphaerae]|uniref:hypothetical protein n=1 Tax=Paraburkholderia rhizosphaerae TaxID=480658 RepID=UPI001FB87067|nr:hypothetical protein [Paraburkholderia rhizosphaerae]